MTRTNKEQCIPSSEAILFIAHDTRQCQPVLIAAHCYVIMITENLLAQFSIALNKL